MNISKVIFGGLSSIITCFVLFTGCFSQPPTEKVTSIQSDISACESQGARVFTPKEYEIITQKMNMLKENMNKRKYKQATILADSIIVDLGNLKIFLESNGKNIGHECLMDVNNELEKMRTLITSDNFKMLNKNERETYNRKFSGFETRVSNLKKDMENASFLRVYNSSRILKEEIAVSNETINKRVERAVTMPKGKNI